MNPLYNIKSKVVSWFSDIRIYNGGVVLFGSDSYAVKGEHIRKIINTLIPGDVLLRRYNHYLGSRLIKGYWSHAAIYIGNNTVIQMLGSGIGEEDILTFTRCDDVCILRSNDVDLNSTAILKALDYLSKKIPYDFDFDEKDNKLYCTELVDDVFGAPIRAKLGKDKIILPDHFLDCSSFQCVFTVYGPKGK